MQKRCLFLFGVLLLSFFYSYPQSPTPESPALFFVSTNLNERDMAISPDGMLMFYTLLGNQNSFSAILMRKKLPNGKWSEPQVAPFSGMYKDLEPAFSPDGHRLFFSSDRPFQTKNGKDYDIWMVEELQGEWASATHLGPTINTDANEFYPSVAKSGNLYFTAAYESKGVGKEDIFVSRWINGSFSESVALDSAVNSKVWEFNAFVDPDEHYILFTSYGRKDDAGGGDLYISTKDAKGQWRPATNLKQINSPKLDYCPYVTIDNKTLFFTSQRHEMPSSYEKAASYDVLVNTYNGIPNGSDNIYSVGFKKILDSVK